MFSIRKFYNVDAPEAPSTPTTGFNVAELMAKQGVVNTTDSMVATPIDITPRQEDVKMEQPVSPVEPTTETTTAIETITEGQTPKEPEQPIAPIQKEEVQPVQVTWQQVLKQQPDAVFKELGFDEKVVSLAQELNGFEKLDYFLGLVNEWKTNGNIDKYVKELSTDYVKMPAEEVMRHQLRQEYPKASEQALNALFKKEVVQAYNLNSEDEAEAEEGKLLLEAKADKYRDAMIESQKQYLTPKPPDAKIVVPDNTEQLIQIANEAYKNRVIENNYAKDVFGNKRISIGEGEDKFNFPIEPDDIKGLLFDDGKWQESMYDIVNKPDGTQDYVPKTEHQLLVAAVAKYGVKLFNEYAKHFKAIGGKAAIDPIESAKKPDAGTPSASEKTPTSVAEFMAKQGRLV